MGQLLLFSKESRALETHELTVDEVDYIVNLLESSKKALSKKGKLVKRANFDDLCARVLALHKTRALGRQSHLGMLLRMVEKLIRACEQAKHPHTAQDGSLEDTLLDLANYLIMTILAIREYHPPKR